MAVEPGSRNPTRFGISRQSLDEIQGIAILFVGSVCFLALFSANKPSNLIGPSGAFLAKWLTFVVGRIVAYFVPSVLLLWGVSRFRGIGWTHPLFRIVGLLLVVVAGCGLLYQMGYDLGRFSSSQNERDYVSFQWSGVLGAFLVSSGGLNIPRYIGTTGAYLAFGSLSAIGILLATNFLFYSFFVSLWQRLRHGREAISARVQRLVERGQKEKALPGAGRFRRSHSARVFGGGADDSTAAATDMPEAEQHELPSLVVESPIGHAVEVDDERDEEEEQNQSEVALSRPDQMALFAGYQIPSLDLLSAAPPSNESLSEKDIEVLSRTIEEKLASFDIEVEVTNVTQGPVVTLFELQTAEGVKIGRIVTLENDLAMALRASRLRILAPIPGRGTVGIEIPNRKPTVVRLREILESREFQSQDAALLFGVGKTIDGKPYICNLAKMPHLLIAGTTGSGKSVCLNAIICSFLLRNSPDRLRLIMIDPKRVELSVYQGIPHLLAPVVNDPRKSAAALAWVLTQMEERYRQLAEMGLRNIDAYNALALDSEQAIEKYGRELPYMPHIVIVIDELADLMFIARNEVEENIIRLSQMSRAVGIHLIVATQRPTVNVITGIIKANFPCRIAFQVSSKIDSRTILDMNGAEALLGQGDMLFSGGGSGRPIRLQGAYVSDAEVERLVEFITAQGKAMTEEQLEAERQIALVREKKAEEQKVAAPQAPEEPAESDEAVEETASSNSGAAADEAEPDRAVSRQPVRVQYTVDDFGSTGNGEGQLSDELYDRALRLILESKKASVSLIQRRMKIGFARAGRLMDLMEDRGIVGPYQGSKPRQLRVDPIEYLRKLDSKKR